MKGTWIIQGFQASEQTFHRTVSADAMSLSEVSILLQRLAARDLSFDEIFATSLRANNPDFSPALRPRMTSKDHFTVSVGTDPLYIATLVPSEEAPAEESENGDVAAAEEVERGEAPRDVD